MARKGLWMTMAARAGIDWRKEKKLVAEVIKKVCPYYYQTQTIHLTNRELNYILRVLRDNVKRLAKEYQDAPQDFGCDGDLQFLNHQECWDIFKTVKKQVIDKKEEDK